jgi:hypothetical protein
MTETPEFPKPPRSRIEISKEDASHSVWAQWNRQQDEAGVPATLREATVIADLIMQTNNVPAELRPWVEKIWDDAFRQAIEFTSHAAGLLVFIRQEIRDDDTD